MEPCQMFEEFASNVKKIVASKDNDREYGVEWMKKFEESEHVFTTCCRILSSSLGDDVKRHAVKLLRSKIAKTSASFDENGALDLYRELISTLETSPSIEIGTQITVCLSILFTTNTIWKISVQKVLEDILSIDKKSLQSSGDSDESIFPIKIALVFLKRIVAHLQPRDDRHLVEIRAKIEHGREFIGNILVDFLKCFRQSLCDFRTTIEVCRMMTRVIPPEHVMESNIIMRIHQIIQEMDTEDPGYIRALVKYLVSSVSVFEPLINGETCSSYGLGLRIVLDLQIFLESAIKRNDRELINSITYISVTLAVKFFNSYVISDCDTYFSFLDMTYLLNHYDHEYYNIWMRFWLNYENYQHMSENPKFEIYFLRYCEILFDETLKALAVSNTGHNENLFDGKDEFLSVFRNNIRKCLQTAFKLISPQPYLEILLSSIRTDPNDFSKLEPGIFYASSMLNNPKFAVDCHEVVKLILNIPPDAPVTLIKTCCEFLRDFIENCDVAENCSRTQEISFDSIYQWLATVPDPASETLKRDREPRKDVLSDNISDCKYINNILVRCRESDHVERLAKLIGDVIRNTHENDAIEVLRGVLDFYKDPVYHQIENNSDRSESARITIFHMTALSIILNNTGDVNVNWDHFMGTMTNAIDFCIDTMTHFKDNEEVWERVCDVLGRIFQLSKLFEEHKQCFCEQMADLFELSPFSSLIDPVRIFRNNLWGKYYYDEWSGIATYTIQEQTMNVLLNKDSNDYPRLVERNLKLFKSMLASQYEETINSSMSSNLVRLATHGLLMKDEKAVIECIETLIELFVHPSVSFCSKDRRNSNSVLIRFFHSQIKEIVTNCISVILSPRNNVLKKACANLLRIMKGTEERLIGTHVHIAEDLAYQILTNYQDKDTSETLFGDYLIKVLSSSHEKETEQLVVELDSKL